MNQPETEVEPGLKRTMEHLQSVLIPGETLEAWAVQRRLYALNHRRLIVAATTGRFICLMRNVIGGFVLHDLRWQDLQEVRIRVGIFAADLTVRSGDSSDLALQGQSPGHVLELRGLRTSQAEAVYRICQAQDQAWREKRRVRELEELRARSGGIALASGSGALGSAAATGSTPGAPSEAVRRLQEAKQMLEARLISDAEYEAVKAKILSGS
jgi:hypothetical protein